MLVAASVVLLVGLVVGALVAGGVINRTPKPLLPAVVDGPSPRVIGSTASPSASAMASPSAVASQSTAPRSSTPPAETVVSAWTLPTGWRYELNCDDDGSACGLSLFDEAGRLADGWPVVLGGSCEYSPVAVGPDGSLFVACTVDRRAVVYGLDRSGNPLPGWPASLRGAVARSVWNDFAFAYGWPAIAVGPDATVYVATDVAGNGYAIHALAPDASTRSGWPVEVSGDERGFTVAPDGDIAAWWYEDAVAEIGLDARRTVFTMIAPNGRVRPGWPRGSTGAASGPVLWEDGSLYYVSKSGKVWGLDRGGKIIEGWPYQLASPIAPGFRADGTLIFIEDARVVVLDRQGHAAPGWPYKTKGSLSGPSCDTDGFPLPLAAVAEDDTLYLASWDGDRSWVAAVRADGATVDGWPFKVPTGWRVADISFEDDGTLRTSLYGDPCGGPDATSIQLDAHGTIVGDAPRTPLSRVYQAMRLDALRTTSGNGSFVQGAQIDFDVALVNRSSGAISLPHVSDDDHSWYAAGTLQTWLEPLAPGPPLWTCLRNPSQGNERYATGGEVIVTAEPLTIQPGGTMPSLLDASLSRATTACLPAGRYRYRVEYKRYGVEKDDVMDEDDPIDQATLDFTITAAAPSVTSTPSPTPLPPAPAPTPPPAAASPS